MHVGGGHGRSGISFGWEAGEWEVGGQGGREVGRDFLYLDVNGGWEELGSTAGMGGGAPLSLGAGGKEE